MDVNPPTKKKTASNQEAFDRLLLLLDPDRDRAGEKYELLRLKLAQFFRSRVCPDVEDLADKVFDRLLGKIAAGEEIRNVYGYSLGIARLVWLESLRDPEARHSSFDDLKAVPLLTEDEIDKKSRLACFNLCLRELPEADAALLVEYCSCEHGSKSAVRQQIADKLQVPIGALRLRVHRIKTKLFKCFDDCLTKGPKKLK